MKITANNQVEIIEEWDEKTMTWIFFNTCDNEEELKIRLANLKKRFPYEKYRGRVYTIKKEYY